MNYTAMLDRLEELRSIPEEVFEKKSVDEMRSINSEMDELSAKIAKAEKEGKAIKEQRDKLANGGGVVVKNFRSEVKMENTNNNAEIRSLQKYMAGGSLTDVDMRSLTLADSGAVLPVEIANKLLYDEAYSDLLHRVTVINQGGSGTIKIPVASRTDASWKAELEEVASVKPDLTSINLGGHEIMRLITMSQSVASMSERSFKDHLMTLLSSELLETIEKSMINGDGIGKPQGIASLTYTDGVNGVDTAEISPADVAKALSLLPQKHARGAVILANASTIYETVGLFKGTAEFAYNLADGATKFMGKDLIISEHVADGEIYILDPKQYYLRFAEQIAVEADRSVGFRSMTVDLRASAVVDGQMNESAIVRIKKTEA